MTEDTAGIILGVCPARGGSRRVPRKNVRLVGNKPLIAWTIEQAKQAKSLDYFLVSTGDAEIREISNQYLYDFDSRKARVIQRPKKLCEDVDSSLVIRHAVEWFEKKKQKPVSHVVCLQPTSPFRNFHDIDACVHLAKTCNADTVVSVVKVSQHPYWMFETDIFGRLVSYMNVRLEGKNLVSQSLPLLWYPNGAVYVTNRSTIAEGKIFGNRMISYPMPRDRSIDLEEEIDFFTASAIIQHYGSDFHVKSAPKTVVKCDDG